MDPCMIAAEILGACVSEAPIEIKAQPKSADTAENNSKNFSVGPSATVMPPETSALPQGTTTRSYMGSEGTTRPAKNGSTESISREMGTSLPQGNHPTLSRMPQPLQSSPAVGLGPYPASGDQLFAFRAAALQAGEMYTRTSPQQYQQQWQRSTTRASYQQWQELLAQEAAIMAHSQGNNRLTILVGDSLSLWLPTDRLCRNRFWLNQSISGETSGQILNRLHYFRATRPDQIHVMAGINDLKNGASDGEIIRNLHQMLVRLRQQHPGAQLVIYSILPTRLDSLPSDRIRTLNQHIAYIAHQQGAQFSDLQTSFADSQGLLRQDLTTDGLHLSRQGYEVWQAALAGI